MVGMVKTIQNTVKSGAIPIFRGKAGMVMREYYVSTVGTKDVACCAIVVFV